MAANTDRRAARGSVIIICWSSAITESDAAITPDPSSSARGNTPAAPGAIAIKRESRSSRHAPTRAARLNPSPTPIATSAPPASCRTACRSSASVSMS